MSAPAAALPRSIPASTGILLGLSVLAAFVAFRGGLFELVHRWYTQDEYSHGFFIPLIVMWLLWTRRNAIYPSIGYPSWTGPALIAVATAFLVLGELSALFILSQVGFVVVLIGIALAVGGTSLLVVTFIPLVFLLFAIPLPYFVDSVLSYRLQLISSELGVFVIRLFQIPVFLEGNVIDLGAYKLQVIEACSGLRYLYPFLSLGFLAAYMFHAPLWQRALVFVSTVPITIIMNSFRIGMIGVMVDRWGSQSADGFLHFFEGWIIFLACAALLAAEMALLARFASGKTFFEVFYPPKVEPSIPPERAREYSGLRRPLAASLVLLFAAGIAATAVAGRQEIVPERRSFATFPMDMNGWRGRQSQLETRIEHHLGLTDYILSDYDRGDSRWVNFYVAYYASQRRGVSPHSPAVCIPGGGWQISEFERTTHRDEVLNLTLPFNRVIIQRDGHRQVVYYWFVQRGRKVENEWISKWYLLSDAILRNRTDGALVRLTTMVFPGETDRDADLRLKSFFRELEPRLEGYLPQETLTDARAAQARPQLGKS